jgi:hypothetical protein
MIDTNARTANGMAAVRGPGLRDWFVRRLEKGTGRVRADETAGLVYAAQTRHEVGGLEPQLCDPGATPTRWVRLV